MKFYVASKFGKYQYVRRVVDRLKEAGHEITYDWTRTDEFDENGVLTLRPETDIPPEKQRQFAHEDMQGVLDCDAVLLLWTPDMAGAYIEVGMALATGKKVYIVGQKRWTIFYAMEQVKLFKYFVDFQDYLDTLE